MIDKFLGLGFVESSFPKIALDIDIEERGDASERHGGAVLLFDGSEVSEVKPLESLGGVSGGAPEIEAIKVAEFSKFAERSDLGSDFFAELDGFGGGGEPAEGFLLLFFVGDKAIKSIESNAAVVADDAAPSIGIGESGKDMAFAASACFVVVGVEDGVVLGTSLGGLEGRFEGGVHGIAIGFEGFFGHPESAEGHEGAFERLIGLKTDDALEVPIDVTRSMGEDAGDDGSVAVENSTLFPFLGHEIQDFGPEKFCFGSRGGKEVFIAVIGGDIPDDEIADINFSVPVSGLESAPRFLGGGGVGTGTGSGRGCIEQGRGACAG
jgi:hypothetical protein